MANTTFIFCIGETLSDGTVYKHYLCAPTIAMAKDRLKLKGAKGTLKEIEKNGPYTFNG